MDPDACLRRVLAALEDGDLPEAEEAWEDYQQWLRSGGFEARPALAIEAHDAWAEHFID